MRRVDMCFCIPTSSSVARIYNPCGLAELIFGHRHNQLDHPAHGALIRDIAQRIEQDLLLIFFNRALHEPAQPLIDHLLRASTTLGTEVAVDFGSRTAAARPALAFADDAPQ